MKQKGLSSKAEDSFLSCILPGIGLSTAGGISWHVLSNALSLAIHIFFFPRFCSHQFVKQHLLVVTAIALHMQTLCVDS